MNSLTKWQRFYNALVWPLTLRRPVKLYKPKVGGSEEQAE